MPRVQAPAALLDFTHQAVSCLPRRQQRVLAAYYVALLHSSSQRNLSRAVPANVYRSVRHFLADADWDGREVLWRAVAKVLPDFAIEWLSCSVSKIGGQYAVAWLAAYDATDCLVLDLVLVGPAGPVREPRDYVPAQVELLRTVPNDILRQAPLHIADALAESATVRAGLAARGITYSAKIVRPGRATAGHVTIGGRQRTLATFASRLREEEKLRRAPGGIEWAWRRVSIQPATGPARDETLLVYWHQNALASLILTNEDDPERLAAIYDPGRPGSLARPRRSPRWRSTRLRGVRAWEHHLTLWFLHEAARIHVHT